MFVEDSFDFKFVVIICAKDQLLQLYKYRISLDIKLFFFHPPFIFHFFSSKDRG